MKITLAIVLCLALAMSSAFKIRQGDVAADIGAGVGAANQAITDGEELFNDAVHGTQAAIENFAGQAVNGAGALAGMISGGAPAGGARLQQTAADAVNTATADASTLATDATTVATDAANVAADLGSQFVNTATNFFGGLAGTGGAGRLQQGNLAADINALGQASLGALHDTNQAFDDALDQSEMIANNVLSTSEQAFGANGAAVANPDRLQQDPATLTQDATDLSNDVAATANAGIQTFNDIAQQGLQAFSGLMGGAAAPAAARRLQRFH
uniref:Uncharacterized protein n=1 Tax=Euplotes crassus TaxID=5936 RepID=A0A7S3KWE8_EUPCR|mmetsp:Transcript_9216/g.8845  ORF Transcript_9216/g.8845 Transcript_9216/m.8845 type:complete len:271 (+) Transcript_9216:6-818(+)